MNWDKIEGNWKLLKGSVQAHWGKLTDDDFDVVEGNRQKLVGRIQEQYGVARDEAERQVDGLVPAPVRSPRARQGEYTTGPAARRRARGSPEPIPFRRRPPEADGPVHQKPSNNLRRTHLAQQDLAAAIPTAGADYDAVVKQLAALRTEMEKHAATVSQVPSNRGQVLTADVSGSMAEAGAISAGRPRTARRNSRVPWRRTLTSLSA